MSIRLRTVDGYRVALCAARSMPMPGDLYLDDGDHHALSIKFGEDFASMGFLGRIHADCPEVPIMEREESDNPNRDDWDRTFGPGQSGGPHDG